MTSRDNILHFLFLIGFLLMLSSCSKENEKNEPELPVNSDVKTKLGTANTAAYKIFYQEANQADTRKGIIILAVGDGGNENDVLLNEQCEALAQKGFVAITTTYRPMAGDYYAWYKLFQEDMEKVIAQETATFAIARNKIVLGGLSRGGNLLLGSVTPTQNMQPIMGIKGVILACAGGDQWKGASILYPVLFMSNATDAAVGTHAEQFKNALQNNPNPDVKSKSKVLIIPGEGHCTGSNQYKDFIINHIDSWF